MKASWPRIGNFRRVWLAFSLLLITRLAFAEGIGWITKGILSMFVQRKFRKGSWLHVVIRFGYYTCIVLLVWRLNLTIKFLLYWIIPYCTWHIAIQYIRIICELSAIPSSTPPYHLTRTTIPFLWERILILPRNIGSHHEHHWYPGLHAVLTTETKFGQCGVICRGVMNTLGQRVTSDGLPP